MKAATKTIATLALFLGVSTICAPTSGAAQQIFSASPMVPIHVAAPGRTNVQRFNGTFVAQVLSAASTSQARSCLRMLDGTPVTVTTFSSGTVRLSSSAICVSASARKKNADAAGTNTGSVELSASRILAIMAANGRFNSVPRFAHNDRNLVHYDVEVYDAKGAIRVAFLPPAALMKQPGVETLGCPHTGPIPVTYIIDPQTLTVTDGVMAC